MGKRWRSRLWEFPSGLSHLLKIFTALAIGSGEILLILCPILMETGNPSQGRLRGRTNGDLVVTGEDKMLFQSI